MGTGKSANLLHVIDFGLCKQYRETRTFEHIPLIKGKSLIGTARYASKKSTRSNVFRFVPIRSGLHTHQGFEQSRRDDLESLIYVLIYLSRGKLPWMGIKVSEKRKKYEMIAAKKQSITRRELFDHVQLHSFIKIR